MSWVERYFMNVACWLIKEVKCHLCHITTEIFLQSKKFPYPVCHSDRAYELKHKLIMMRGG